MWYRRLTVVAVSIILSACVDDPNDPGLPQRSAGGPADIRQAIAAQERHNRALFAVAGVTGTAVGVDATGRAVVEVFLLQPGVAGVPAQVDGIPVVTKVTGRFMARSNPTTRARPAPIGFSVGHPSITAGTIGALTRDAAGNYYVLSNNHVLANSNNAVIGDGTLQPGPYDGGRDPGDRIGTLHAFQMIDFSGANNTMDAAIARVTTAEVSASSPTDDGYGLPSSGLYNDANADGRFDDITQLLNVNVMKYGRTTKLTRGRITGINGVVDVCYEVVFIFCTKSAHYVDQLLINVTGFSQGGDSGSMIVTDDANKNPVALLFGGSETQTIANRMDLVLQRFGLRIEGAGSEPPPPPPASTDISVASVTAPASVTQGDVVSVSVVIQNVGTTAVSSDLTVVLNDNTAAQQIGSQVISGGLAAGASRTLTYAWNTAGAGAGAHTLAASHNFTDDNAANNTRSTAVTVNVPTTVGLHNGNLDAFSIKQNGGHWIARVIMTAHGPNHEILVGAQVGGIWSDGVEFTCTTNSSGQCLAERVLRNQTAVITFTHAGIVYGSTPFTPEHNHDPGGDSDGTQITVRKPQ